MMKLAKNKFLELLIILVVLVTLNVLFFTLPFVRSPGFWIAYGFSMTALVIAAAMSLRFLWRGNMRSKFYGLPILYVSWIYAALQIVLGFVFVLVPAVPLWVELPLSVILLGACVAGLSAVELGIGEISRLVGTAHAKVLYLRALQTEVETLAAGAADGDLKKALNEYAAALRYSDPMSSPQLAELESGIAAKTAELGKQAETEKALALCGELQKLLAERNRKCRLLK
jgi:hypothetical protein